MSSLYMIVGVFALINFVCEASSLSNDTHLADTFLNPPSHRRPRFRYWLPDASVDAGTVEADIKSAGAVGAGGIEFLPFYNYGGELGGPPPGVNWSTYGFGTPAHLDLFTSALEAHKEAGMVMDFSLGPNQGQGIPAHPDDEGLQWDLVSIERHTLQLDCLLICVFPTDFKQPNDNSRRRFQWNHSRLAERRARGRYLRNRCIPDERLLQRDWGTG
jgi:hypothetical protein